jgi:phosphoribosyl 1,2-cyclic phosphodiesterase
MPLNFCLLGSGSKGNSVYISDGDSAVLVDCGFSARQCILRMEKRGLDPGRIQAIVITHEHRDHCSGARVLAKRLKAPVWATKGTWRAIGDLDGAECNTIIPNRGLRAGRLELRPFTIPHDANDPVGFVIQGQNGKLGIATDLGQSTRLVQDRLKDCDGLIIEANHDPGLLDQGPYPPWLKQRVKGSHGHLSNQDGAELIARLHHERLKQVVLAHLSETNNRPDLARKAAAIALDELGSQCGLEVAGQHEPSRVFRL